VDGEIVGQIGPGLLVLLGVQSDDTDNDAFALAEKTAGLRIFEDAAGKMNLSVVDTAGAALVVSQFTLLADCRQGRRPGFSNAAPPEIANTLYERFIGRLRDLGLKVETGVFQAEMDVRLTNKGPVTLLLDSRKAF
jgi:D-aminoacyl-tRNA deacylase